MAVSEAAREAVWLMNLRNELTCRLIDEMKCVEIYEDNNGCIDLTKSTRHHDRSKHIDVQHHFIREKVEEGLIKLNPISTANQVADIMTKGLDVNLFTRHQNELGVTKFDSRWSVGIGESSLAFIDTIWDFTISRNVTRG
jgi:hypothetical protein